MRVCGFFFSFCFAFFILVYILFGAKSRARVACVWLSRRKKKDEQAHTSYHPPTPPRQRQPAPKTPAPPTNAILRVMADKIVLLGVVAYIYTHMSLLLCVAYKSICRQAMFAGCGVAGVFFFFFFSFLHIFLPAVLTCIACKIFLSGTVSIARRVRGRRETASGFEFLGVTPGLSLLDCERT